MLPENTFPLHTLPALNVSHTELPTSDQVQPIISEWFSSFTNAIEHRDIDRVLHHFVPDGNAYWRDIMSLTWDYRTFAGLSKIRTFLEHRLASSEAKIHSIQQSNPEYASLVKPYDDIAWIQFLFTFQTGNIGNGKGVIRLVPFPAHDGTLEWKAQGVLTTLDSLQSFPEKTGANRDHSQEHSTQRELYTDPDTNPTVLVIGGGQSGLEVAARLKFLDVKTLVIEKDERFGGNWRSRYDALTLHDPVWFDHMPYLPFPSNWPVYSPAHKMANWLEFYAEAMSLDYWLSSTATSAKFDEQQQLWTVLVTTTHPKTGTKSERTFTVKHVVFALGFSGEYKIPTIPGMDTFGGEIMHSHSYKRSEQFKGKRVAVVGACTSAHDISADLQRGGIDVTMVQRSSTYVMSTKNGWKVMLEGLFWENGPPTEIADLISGSFPNSMQVELGRRQVKVIAELDRELLDGLDRRGFKTNTGYLDSGCLMLAWTKSGGYYLDTGASQLIVDGKIQLKSGSISHLEKTGLAFEDGSRLDADVVIFATGLGSVRSSVLNICGSEYEDKIKPIWSLDDEGEFCGTFRDTGMPGLWVMMGNLAVCRFNSKLLALQIKAMEEGIFGERYST